MSKDDPKKEAGPGANIVVPIVIALIGAFATIIVAFKEPITERFFGTPTPSLLNSTTEVQASLTPGITSTVEVSAPPTFTPSPQALVVNGVRYTFPDLKTAPHCIAPEVATGETRAQYNIQIPKGWVMVWDSNKAFWFSGRYENNGLLVIYGDWTGSIEIEKGGSCSVPVEWLEFALQQRRGSFPVESRPEFFIGVQP